MSASVKNDGQELPNVEPGPDGAASVRSNLVYRYGLLPPTVHAPMVRDHLRASHRYRNLLTEIERGRRSALRLAEADDPALAGLDAAIAMLDAECAAWARDAKRSRSHGRTRVITPQLKEGLVDARARLKRAKMGRRLYRSLYLLPRLQDARDVINERAGELRRNLRAHRRELTGALLYHGTYTLVEDAARQAAKLPLDDDPRFARWGGEGSLGVQIQGGIGVADLATDTQLQIVAGHGRRPCNRGRGTHKACTAERCVKDGVQGRGARLGRTLRLRLESDYHRRPIFAEWPMMMHRPVPEAARIMNAVIHVRRIGAREEWSLTLTLRLERAPRRNDGLAVAVDVGWRLLPDGSMRVAYWRGEDGNHDQLVLSARQLSGLTKADSIRSIRDRILEQLRAGLVGWLERLPDPPTWLVDARRWMPQWRSPERFIGLIRTWEATTFERELGDLPRPAAVLAWLHAWERDERHLRAYECDQRVGAERHRRDHYRRFAAWLNQRYDVVVLENFDKRNLNRTKLPEHGAATEDVRMHRAQRLACTSQLDEALRSRFGQRGQVTRVEAAGTTIVCAECGRAMVGDAADDIIQRCEAGHVWDQDDNACRNLLRERRAANEITEGARGGNHGKAEARWARAQRLREEKAARMQSARNPRGK